MDDQTNQEETVNKTPTEDTKTPDAPALPKNPELDCAHCSGSGLVDEARCANCQGTGKAQNSSQAFPDGTQVLRQDGTYNVVNGVEVKQD